MTCKDMKDMIPLYHYGELENGESEAVRKHLASCGACREELESVERVLKGVTAPEAPDLPGEFWSQNAEEIMRRVRKRSFAIPISLAAGVAAAVILFLSITRVDPGPEPDAVSRQVLVETPVMSDTEIALEIEGIESDMDRIWDSQSPDDFDSGFAQALDAIESSIDELFMEFEFAGPWGIGANGSV